MQAHVDVSNDVRVSRGVATRTKLVSLAYADDIVLFSTCTNHMQRALSILETHAGILGLKLNVGPEKTARLVVDSDRIPLRISSGAQIPDVLSYKYLGVPLYGYKRVADFNARRKTCWAVIRSFSAVWNSFVPLATKRRLFYAIISGLWTYAELAWPSHITQDMLSHACFSRMLRFCLGVPSSYFGGALRVHAFSSGTAPSSQASTCRTLGQRALRRHSFHLGRAYPCLGPFDKTVAANAWRAAENVAAVVAR